LSFLDIVEREKIV